MIVGIVRTAAMQASVSIWCGSRRYLSHAQYRIAIVDLEHFADVSS